MTRPKLRPGRSCKTMGNTMAVVAEPGTRVPRLCRRWECVNISYFQNDLRNQTATLPHLSASMMFADANIMFSFTSCFHRPRYRPCENRIAITLRRIRITPGNVLTFSLVRVKWFSCHYYIIISQPFCDMGLRFVLYRTKQTVPH